MRTVLLAVAAVLVHTACAASGTGASGGGSPAHPSADPNLGGRPRAMAMSVADTAFHDPKFLMAKSMPPQFTLMLTREMPTPGWSFEVDDVDIDEDAGRIVARITEVAPDGMSAQVITDTPLRIPLGMIGKGRYLIEIHVRRGASGEHRLAQALVVDAR
jgi:hypothetical protein